MAISLVIFSSFTHQAQVLLGAAVGKELGVSYGTAKLIAQLLLLSPLLPNLVEDLLDFGQSQKIFLQYAFDNHFSFLCMALAPILSSHQVALYFLLYL
jgi:hypothetical protein